MFLKYFFTPGFMKNVHAFFKANSFIVWCDFGLDAWHSYRVVVFANYDVLASRGHSPRSLPTCRTKFIAWCLRRHLRGMPTASRMFLSTTHEFRFEHNSHHKAVLCHILTRGMSDKSQF